MSQWILHAFKTGLLTCVGCGIEKPINKFPSNLYYCNECEKHDKIIKKDVNDETKS
jgi:hypothetical protein